MRISDWSSDVCSSDLARWLRACRTWQDAGLAMENPADVLAWNSDKRYLETLRERGIAIPATTWSDRVTRGQINAMLDETSAESLIVKPTVSGGAWKTRRLRRGDALDGTPDGGAMIQPYLPSIQTEGATYLPFFGGRLSHYDNKRPVAGAFRIPVQFGGLSPPLPKPPPGAPPP